MVRCGVGRVMLYVGMWPPAIATTCLYIYIYIYIYTNISKLLNLCWCLALKCATTIESGATNSHVFVFLVASAIEICVAWMASGAGALLLTYSMQIWVVRVHFANSCTLITNNLLMWKSAIIYKHSIMSSYNIFMKSLAIHTKWKSSHNAEGIGVLKLLQV